MCKQHRGNLKGLRYDSVEYRQIPGVVNTAKRMMGRRKARKVDLYNILDPRPYGI